MKAILAITAFSLAYTASPAYGGMKTLPVTGGSGGGGGTVTGVTATAPIQSSGGTAPVISCIAASGSVAGCLSAANWTTFNNKQSALTFSAPLVNTTGTISCTAASGSGAGCLSSADWTTFNGKQATGLTVLKAGDTMSGALVNSKTGAASTPSLSLTGAPYAAGSATTNKPLVLLEDAAASTAWSTAGTYLGVNAATAFTGNLFDVQSEAVSRLKVTAAGALTVRGSSASTVTDIALQNPTNSTLVTFEYWSGGNLFSMIGAGTGFFNYGVGTGLSSFGYNSSTPRYLFDFQGAHNSTAPGDVVANGASVTPPTLVTRNTNSTTGNYGGLMNAGSSNNVNGWVLVYNDTQTSSSEDSHVGIATASAGTKSEKMKIGNKGQIELGGTAPTVGSCGSSPSIVGNDNVGRVTVGTGGAATSCVVTFAKTWANAPICVANNETTVLLAQATATTTTLTITSGSAFTASDKLTYHCLGYF